MPSDPLSARNGRGRAPQPAAAAATAATPSNSDVPAAVLDAVSGFDDFDIQVLYEILQVAQADPVCAARPYQAIFPAHEAVLGQHGLSRATADSPYLRFLYRLPALRRSANERLVDVFERVLVRVGITIESASEGSSGDRTRTSRAGAAAAVRKANVQPDGGRDAEAVEADLRQTTRRSSFSDFIDEEWRSAPRRRADSRVSVSRLQDHSEGFGARMPEPAAPQKSSKQGRGRPATDTREHKQTASKSRNRSRSVSKAGKRVGAQLQPTTPERRVRKHPAVQKTPESNRPSPAAAPAGGWLSRDALRRLELLWRTNSERGDNTTELPSDLRGEPTPAAQERAVLGRRTALPAPLSEGDTEDDNDVTDYELIQLPRPSLEQLDRDARTFDRFRMEDLLRMILRHWSAAAAKHKADFQESYDTAVQLDRQALLQQAFKRWELACRLKKHLRNAEQFYRSLEERATRARNFRLLAKAFTHWAEYGAEERQRSEAARRHILRLKYFHAWQEITTANQLKVRKFALGKFFNRWKNRLVQTLIKQNHAAVIREERIVRGAYWSWFWRFCGERAPQWRDGLLQRRYLSRWADTVQQRQEMDSRVAMMRMQGLLKKHLHAWRAKTAQVKQQDLEAAAFQRAHTVARALPPWRRQLRLAPAALQVQGMVERRVVSQCFKKWAARLDMAQQAQWIDGWRIARHAWTQWNDALRIRLMQQQHAERLVASCLYKWVLAERVVHFKRMHEEQTREKALEAAISRYRILGSRLQGCHDQVLASRNQSLLRDVLRRWRERRQTITVQTQQAQHLFTPRITSRHLQHWVDNYNQQLELSEQAESALAYFRKLRSFNAWRAAATTSRKQKLQAAYTTVRVQHKKAQARRVLQTWVSRTNHVLSLVDEAETLLHRRLWALVAVCLEAWEDALADARAADVTASHQRQATLLLKAFEPWHTRAEVVFTQAAQANAFARSGAEKIAFECLRRLQLRLLEQQNLEAKAVRVRSWTESRRARTLLRTWAEAATARRTRSPPAPTPAPARPGTTQAAGPWTEPRGPAQRASAFDERARRSVAEWIPPPPQLPLMPPPRVLELARDDYDHQPAAPSPLPAYLSTPSKRAARARALVAGAPSFTPRTEPRGLLLQAIADEPEPDSEAEHDRGGGQGGFARRSVATIGGGTVRGERSAIPIAARAPQTPLVRSLFRQRVGRRDPESTLGRSTLGRSMHVGGSGSFALGAGGALHLGAGDALALGIGDADEDA